MRFGDHELDLSRFELRRSGRRVRVQPKVLDLLVYLIRNRERVVPKEELLDALWRDVAVAETALTHAVKEARRAVRDTGGRQSVIQTVRGRGYRFVASVQEHHDTLGADEESEAFVGREAVLSYLAQELGSVAKGQGRAVFLTGEPGIGKSRTAARFANSAQESGARSLLGRCVEGQGAPVHWPWAQIVRSALRRGFAEVSRGRATESAAVLARALPGIAGEIGGQLPDLVELPDEEARFRLADALASLFRSASRSAPLVLLLDDLHLADHSSLDLLGTLVEELRQTPVLFVGTYREAELARDAERSRLIGAVARSRGAHAVRLEGLAREEVACFLGTGPGGPVSESLVGSVHERTGGNPFFLTQIVPLLDGGVGGPARPKHEASLPQGVREAIGQHLDVLPESCRDLLSRASVLGRSFELDVLAHVSGVGVDTTLETLESAIDARVVRPVGDSWTRFEFAHALIPETLYDAMSTARRLRLHGRAGSALETLRSDDPNRAAELAHHFNRAAPLGHAAAAVRWSIRASELATRQLAYEETVRHTGNALEGLRLVGSDDKRRLELLLALAEAQGRAGQVGESRDTFQSAAALARERGDAEALARAALGLDWEVARRGAVGTDAVRLALLGEALAAVGSVESSLRVRLLAAMDEALYFEDSPRGGPSLSREAIGMARRIGDADALVFALNRRHLVLRHPTGLDERLSISRELVSLTQRRRQPDLVFDAHGSQIHDALERGEIELVDRALEAFERLAGEHKIPKYLWYADLYRAMRELLAGRFAESEPRIARAYSIGSRVQDDLARLWHVVQMQTLRIDQGRAEGFLPELREVEKLYPLEAMRLNVALVEALTGDLQSARRALDHFEEAGAGAMRRDITWILCVVVLGQLCELCGDEDIAAEIYDLLRPFARQHIVVGTAIVYRGAVATELGRLAALLGRWEEAEHHFATGLARERRMGARPFEAAVQLGWARMLMSRGDEGDREQARRRLGAVLDVASEVGAHQYHRAARELLAGSST
jgi:DNA-binding winged helix-turn-helix (wHTH) protein/tetratricopeptide (TPR) repeat protein